ncbi:lysosomal acid glucosylceramidase-like [Dendroctonus ponderosae]|uniref:lysosomal acid glucosylceramidase n=1 Tax=Dendroctonus ponderosae TaxID=77166 RepID=UPI0020353E63|nr:lysosomal acid glucosylceramidase [Dendroctonus ponderosae]XP_048525990.1 lysosomal acid glucosylceramidase-like [Dendroctonus ponderosae]
MFKLWSFALLVAVALAENPCSFRATDSGGVCVCNSSYCDSVPSLASLASGQYQLYETSKTNLGFTSTTGSFANSTSEADATVTISNLTETYQTILGFGGAFTDATGINLNILTNASREFLIQSYFGDDGIQYSLGRVPIGGTDFSTRGYTYCDVEDDSLDSFALTDEDYEDKIPYILRAIELRGSAIKLFASAWSAPIWMKTNEAYNGFGRVESSYYDLWAEYYLKFFDAYLENNVTFWGVTTQNEPVDGLFGTSVPNNGFTSSEMVNWIKNSFGPTIRNSSYSDLKIMVHDDQRLLLPLLKYQVISDSDVLAYADGIAVHWYTDFITSASLLDFASSDDKDLFRLGTEACIDPTTDLGVTIDLGSWARGERYFKSIIEDLNYDFVGWVDWNMALNTSGGPNWIQNEVDGPIIVNTTSDEFYKQPMFYALGHFSKFVVTDSQRVAISTTDDDLDVIGFVRPDGLVAVVILNSDDDAKSVKIDIAGATEVVQISSNSMNTLLYSP